MLRERLRALTLQQKLTLLLAGTATAALVLFALATLALEAVQSRAALVRDVATQAELLAVTVAPALAFEDPVDATETLAALRTRPEVIAAWLVPLHSTNVFARFARLDAAAPPPAPLTYVGHHFEGRWLFYHEPVSVDRGRVGTLILQADSGGVGDALATYAGLVALLLALVLALCLLLAARLQRLVSAPVLDLAATARRVSESGDYSLRAQRRSGDEIGALADGFNAMLARVQGSEAALRASEERFALALRGATDGLWDWDVPTGRVFYSPRWKEMLGYRADELEHQFKTWERLVHPDDLAPTLQGVAEHLAGRAEQFQNEFRMRHKEGRWVHILSRAIIVRDAAGQPVRLVGTHVDITGLRQTEARLAEAQSIARTGSYELNLRTGVWFWSAEIYRLRQRDPRQGPPSLEETYASIHPEDRARTRAALERTLAEGVDYQQEYRGLLPDGSVRYFLSIGKVTRDEQGRRERFSGTLQDITERKAAEAAREESEKRFRILAESAPIGIFLTGCDGDCRYVNPRWCELTGLTAESAQGEGWARALHPDDRARVFEEWMAAVREAREFRGEYRYLRPDGEVRWVVGGAAPLREAGGLLAGYVGSVVDVTGRRQLERELLEISDREQARLGQEIHDGLCQQLVSAGFTARALEQHLEELRQTEAAGARETAELVDSAISQAYDLVGGLFPAQLDAEGLAAALREFVHRASQRSAVRFTVDYPEPIRLDPAQSTHLFRIAREAVTNALKHARPARVRLRLLEEDGLVRLTIENDGPPITASAPPAGAEAAGGYGLRMMRYRANLLGGTLELRHPPGGGTVVTCAFRAQPPTSPATGPTT
jgi:PAS domain S-box-containing protein